jgi:hypothetical protein
VEFVRNFDKEMGRMELAYDCIQWQSVVMRAAVLKLRVLLPQRQ